MTETEALIALRRMCDESDRRREESPARTFYGDPFPGILSTADVRAILDQVVSGAMPIPEPGPDVRAERADLEGHWVGTRWRNLISMRVSKVVRIRQNESGAWLAVIAREDGKGAENPVPLSELPKRYLRERRE